MEPLSKPAIRGFGEWWRTIVFVVAVSITLLSLLYPVARMFIPIGWFALTGQVLEW